VERRSRWRSSNRHRGLLPSRLLETHGSLSARRRLIQVRDGIWHRVPNPRSAGLHLFALCRTNQLSQKSAHRLKIVSAGKVKSSYRNEFSCRTSRFATDSQDCEDTVSGKMTSTRSGLLSTTPNQCAIPTVPMPQMTRGRLGKVSKRHRRVIVAGHSISLSPDLHSNSEGALPTASAQVNPRQWAAPVKYDVASFRSTA
jgi:hypothetical protein